MNGGSVRIAIPNGWKVPAAGVEVQEGADNDNKRLFLVGTPLAGIGDIPTVAADDGTTAGNVQLAVGGTLATTLKDQRRVTFTFTRTRDGDYITAIEVKLDSENWDTNETKLQITFIDTTVPIPDSLVYPNNDTTMQPYAEYTFITESKTKRGSFTPLNPTSKVLDRHPRVRVGNIEASVAGTVKITPEIAYEGKEYTFKIVFEALGPIYDWDGTDTDIVVEVRNGVSLPSMTTDNVSFSTEGSVRFETTPIDVDTSGDRITINISQINEGNEVSISYGPVTIGDTVGILEDEDSPDQSAFTVSLNTVPLSSDITGGRTQALEGSGTMTFTNPSNARVEVGASGKSLVIRYTSTFPMPLENVQLEIDVAGIETTLQQGAKDAQVGAEPGYVTGSGSGNNPTLAVSSNNTITWSGLSFTKNASFTTTIQKVDIQNISGKAT